MADEGEKKLHDIFLEGWKLYEEVEMSALPSNSSEFQERVKSSMSHFENATRIVSQTGMFSANELIDEVTTESLQYMLLPFFLGKLALKLIQRDRLEVLKVAEVYFKDYIQRCQEYEICEAPKPEGTDQISKGNSGELADLLRAAQTRNKKIMRFNEKKEMEDYIKQMKEAVRNNTVDDEVKREFFLKLLKKSVIEANDELSSISLEKQVVEMRKMQMPSSESPTFSNENSFSVIGHSQTPGHVQGHGHGPQHHNHHHHQAPPKPKPLQPFIITRNNAQKAVFGMGYPSLPVMTVDEFYTQRVNDGVFPDEEKVAKMNQAQVIAAAQDPNEKEDEEKAVVEEQIENDDAEYLARMRRMDEYKDVVRRGDGNRYNRS